MKETCFEYTDGNDKAYFSSNERKWIRKVSEIANGNDEVEILRKPENNQGVIYAKIPKRYFRLVKPTKYTEEQRDQMRERLKTNCGDDEEDDE